MKILFLDQSGEPGGAELCLLDIASQQPENFLIGLFADGQFRQLLESHDIPVKVLTHQPINFQKKSGWQQGIRAGSSLLPLILQVAKLSRSFDVIYANTQKALVVGAIASQLSRRPLVYHLHDILSLDHFSASNIRIAIALANTCATWVIANSQSSREAFIAAGGNPDRVHVIYNGFPLDRYDVCPDRASQLRHELGIDDRYVVGHFSRLSPWKGQHVLLDAIAQCPQPVTVLLVGDALFGEQDYVQQLHAQVTALGLGDRVQFLGFRSDVANLMAACDVIVHTSTAPEPLGRVIVEGMLCGKPVIATAAGGALELVTSGTTGWLTPLGDSRKLAEVINTCYFHPAETACIAETGRLQARQRFSATTIRQQLFNLLQDIIPA